MCVAATAIRRRRQAVQGYNHLAPQQRPRYRRRSTETLARRLAQAIAVERRMSQKRKG